MSDTRTLRRHRPIALPPIPSAAGPVRAQICPADVEAALLDHYPDLVRLAYANLPPNLSRHRRVMAAHSVVQRALPDHRRLERQLAGATDAGAFVRNEVLQGSIKQATARTPVRLLPRAWAIRLLALISAPDDDDFDPCSLRPARRSELIRRNTLGRNVAIVVTSVLALGILASLIAAAVDQPNASATITHR